MNRAERRHRRERAIKRWITLLFNYWRWKTDNGWYKEPGRLAKRTSVCSCFMCQIANKKRWKLDRRAIEVDVAGYEKVLSKHNRIHRGPINALYRGRGRPGTRV